MKNFGTSIFMLILNCTLAEISASLYFLTFTLYLFTLSKSKILPLPSAFFKLKNFSIRTFLCPKISTPTTLFILYPLVPKISTFKKLHLLIFFFNILFQVLLPKKLRFPRSSFLWRSDGISFAEVFHSQMRSECGEKGASGRR